MDILKKTFESLRCQNVRTLLASGNVAFSVDESDTKIITDNIEQALEKTFGFPITVTIRTSEYMKALVKSDPFKDITVTKDVRLYVTFLKEKSKTSLVIPYETPEKDFKIISATSNELFSVLHAGAKTTDAMTFLDKKFGKTVTTRNWNTVQKLAQVHV